MADLIVIGLLGFVLLSVVVNVVSRIAIRTMQPRRIARRRQRTHQHITQRRGFARRVRP